LKLEIETNLAIKKIREWTAPSTAWHSHCSTPEEHHQFRTLPVYVSWLSGGHWIY